MTTVAPPAPVSARDLVTMPEPARGSARAARQALEEPAGEAGQAGSTPFTMDAGASGEKPRRKGGHKPTKAELERELAEARRRLETISGEKPPAALEAELGLRSALGGTFGAAFGFAASARGAHWRLEAEEQDQLAAAWAPVLAPYLASSAQYLPWAVAAGVTYSVVEPRLRRDGERAARELVVEPKPAPAPSSSRPAAAPASASPSPSTNGAARGVRPLDPPAPVDGAPPLERDHFPSGDTLSDHPGFRPGRAI